MKKEIDCKVCFYYHDLEGNVAIESVWASKENDFYRIKNIPFFAPNIAYDDLISVENEDGELSFDELIETSENSTIQIIIFNEIDINIITNEISKYNCGWEGSHLTGYIYVNVPKDINYKKFRQYLSKQSKNKKLGFKEACLSDKHNDEIN